LVEATQILVQKYFEIVEGYFLRENVKFKVKGNYSDIDLLGVNKRGDRLAVEVKSWATSGMPLSEGKQIIDWMSSHRYE
jgi:hypothetical protein